MVYSLYKYIVFMMQVYCFSPILSIKMLLKASVSPSLSRVVCCCYLLLDLLVVDLHDRDDNDKAKEVVDVVEGWQGSKMRVIFWTVDAHLSEGVLHFVELLLLPMMLMVLFLLHFAELLLSFLRFLLLPPSPTSLTFVKWYISKE